LHGKSISGNPPFFHEDVEVQYKYIKDCKYSFLKEYWANVSAEAKALIKALLVIDPKQRLTTADALSHPWMKTKRELLMENSLADSQRSMQVNFTNNKFKSAVRKVSVCSV
jgi:serine/threonine protein kinase